MVSQQMSVVTEFVLTALPAAYLVKLTIGQFVLSFFALLGVGVDTPSLVNDYLNSRECDEDGA